MKFDTDGYINFGVETPLEEALRRATWHKDERQSFLTLLTESSILVISDHDASAFDGRLQLRTWHDDDDRKFLPVFSSPRSINTGFFYYYRDEVKEDSVVPLQVVEISPLAVFEKVSDAPIVVNPYSHYSKMLEPDEYKALAEWIQKKPHLHS